MKKLVAFSYCLILALNGIVAQQQPNPQLVLPDGNILLSACLSEDGKQLATVSKDNKLKLWDLSNFGLTKEIYSPDLAASFNCNFSVSKKYVAISINSSYRTKIFDVKNGQLLYNLTGWVQDLNGSAFSPDENYIITSHNPGGTAIIWDLATGKPKFELGNKSTGGLGVHYGIYSPDGRYIFTGSGSGAYTIWNSDGTDTKRTGEKTGSAVFCALFDINSENVFIGYQNGEIILYNLKERHEVMKTKGHTDYINDICVSSNNRYFATASEDKSIKIWENKTGILISEIKTHSEGVKRIIFGQNDSTIISKADDEVLLKTDFISNKTLEKRKANKGWGAFSPKADKLMTCNSDKIDLYQFPSLSLLYSVLPLDDNLYLVIDSSGRFDGSKSARNQIYFTCGDEKINLDQIKDQLWVPGLAERIMSGGIINAKKLDELNICDLTPKVEEASNSADEYFFRITPRRGGLGQTILSVNGTETNSYQPGELFTKDRGKTYELKIKKKALKDYFVSEKKNLVTVKAYIKDNSISSRGLEVGVTETNEVRGAPNLYALMIGVSDYKGEELDLKYAAKDAMDLSKLVENTAKKLLNTDTNKHVFIYNLTTNDSKQWPEKKTIQKALEEIGNKASANDILLIFFAGHGSMENESKQFYFLTADASMENAIKSIAEVGISTDELKEWIKPQNIKAQKRILIFDACNSGAAINNFVNIGKTDQGYIAARSDDNIRQIKAIDNLNEKSGLFILAASASNQKAYEMGKYSQGLLTYSLLQAIKLQPDILEEGKYLDVSRWFNAAEKKVSDETQKVGRRQQPQIVSNTNFSLGVVDDEIRKNIIMSNEKPMIAACTFQNDDINISADDLGLNELTGQLLNDISSRRIDAPIIFYSGITTSKDTYKLSGRYIVKGNDITLKVFILQDKEVKQRIDFTGSKDKLEELAKSIADRSVEWIVNKK